MHIKSNPLTNFKKKTLCMHLVQVIILQGIVLFQSLKFYDDEIPRNQANLLVTDLLVLSVTVVSGFILSNFKQFTDLD